MLDLSFLPAEQIDFSALLLPPPQRLPSLRKLGMRRLDPGQSVIPLSRASRPEASSNARDGALKQPSSDPAGTDGFDVLRSSLTAVLRAPARRYVDIVWE